MNVTTSEVDASAAAEFTSSVSETDSNMCCLADTVCSNGIDRSNKEMDLERLSDGSEADEEEEDDAEPRLELMALCFRGSRRLGCARYTARTCRIEVFEVPVLLGMEGAGHQARGGGGAPTALPILSDSDIPSSLLWLVQYITVHEPLLFLPDSGAQPLEDIANVVHADCTRLNAKTAFNENEAMPRLYVMYPHLSPTEVAGRFDLSKTAMLAAMSALLHYTATVRCNVCDVVERPPLGVMYVERMTAQWLHITRTEQHPCGFQGIGRAKEGLSLLATVGHAVSVCGRTLLRQWFQLPSCDAHEIELRQSVVRFFVAPQRRDALMQLRRALVKVRPTNRVFTAMRSGKANLPLFQSLLRTIKGLVAVYEVLLPFAHELDALVSLMATIDVGRLQFMAQQIETQVYRATAPVSRRGGGCGPGPCEPQGRGLPHRQANATDDMAWVAYVDSGGLSSGRVSFQMGVDAPLDQLRLLHTRLSTTLSRKADDALQELSSPLRFGLTVRCLYSPPHGYLLCVDGSRLAEAAASGVFLGFNRPSSGGDRLSQAGRRDESAWALPAAPVGEEVFTTASLAHLLAEQHGWQLQFIGADPNPSEGPRDDLCYFKNQAMLQLDAEVGNLLQRIRSREDHLRRQLEETLLEESLCLLQPTQGIAELDCLLGFAYCAIHRQWSCPRVVAAAVGPEAEAGASVLCIRGGWHPVLQQTIGGGSRRGAAGGSGGGPTTASFAVSSFDFAIHGPDDHVSVITGMSGSGKSAFITAVAHIVFVAHLGSFVPAVEATVPLTGYLFACSGVMDRGAFSSFEAECLALNRVVQHCAMEKAEHQALLRQRRQDATAPPPHRATLILLDDFGRGTCPKDAAALLSATLRFFVDDPVYTSVAEQREEAAGVGCLEGAAPQPLVLCCTHFTEILHNDVPATATAPLGGCDPLRRAPFPLHRIALYAMRCTAAYNEAPWPAPRDHGAANAAAAENAALLKRLRVPTDVVPTFEPTRVTPAEASRHGLDRWFLEASYQHGHNGSGGLPTSAGAALAMVKDCGLDEDALGLWLKTLATLYPLWEEEEAEAAAFSSRCS